MTVVALIATGLLVLVNAFFVIAEYSLVRSRRSKLEAARQSGAIGAGRALAQLERIGTYISVCQVGVTLAAIGIGALGEPTIAHLLDGPLGGPLSHGAAVVIAVIIAYLLVSIAEITAGEIVPKLYTIGHAEGSLRRIARPLDWARVLFTPLTWAVTKISHAMLRALRVNPHDLSEDAGSPAELKALIAESVQGGNIDVGEAGMLSGVFDVHEQQARRVMTPIPAVVTVDVSEDVQTALRRCISSGHTRLVVTEEHNADRVKGLVHSNSLAQQLMADGPGSTIEGLVRDAPIVPETKPLDDLLADLQRERASLAVVVDEYGRTAGIVTVEDIVEEVVGEIVDETDPHGGSVRRLANGDWFVRGHVALADLEDYGLGLPADTGAYNSIGGFVFAELGRLPQRGDTVRANGHLLRVESVRENRIEAVRIHADADAGG